MEGHIVKKAKFATHDQIAAMAKKFGWEFHPPLASCQNFAPAGTQKAARHLSNARSPKLSISKRRAAAKRFLKVTK
jgi:hypothetical protein